MVDLDRFLIYYVPQYFLLYQYCNSIQDNTFYNLS